MPEVDGSTTFGLMQQNPAIVGIPVLLLTAKTARRVDQRRQPSASPLVLFKPFDPLTRATNLRRLGWKD